MADINFDSTSFYQFEVGNYTSVCSQYGIRTATGVKLYFSFSSSMSIHRGNYIKLTVTCNDETYYTTLNFGFSEDTIETDEISISSPFDTLTVNFSVEGEYFTSDNTLLATNSNSGSIYIPNYAGTIEQEPNITIVNNGDNTFKIDINSYGVGGDNNPIDKSKFTIYWGTYGRYNTLYTGGNIPITEDTYISAKATTYGELGDSLSYSTGLEMIYIAPYVKINALYNNTYQEGTLYALYNDGNGLKYIPVKALYKNQSGSYTKIN